jgi:hypothetical protein
VPFTITQFLVFETIASALYRSPPSRVVVAWVKAAELARACWFVRLR